MGETAVLRSGPFWVLSSEDAGTEKGDTRCRAEHETEPVMKDEPIDGQNKRDEVQETRKG